MAKEIPNSVVRIVDNQANSTIDIVANPVLSRSNEYRLLQSHYNPRPAHSAGSEEQVFQIQSNALPLPREARGRLVRSHISRVLQASWGVSFAIGDIEVIDRHPKGKPIIPKVHM